MADVSIYVALISASAGVVGAAVSPFGLAFKEGRQAKRDRAERHATAVRQVCVDLLSAAGSLRTQVTNNRSFIGDRNAMGLRLEAVREYASATAVHAASVSLLARDLAEPADRVAAAAKTYADAAAESTDLVKGWMAVEPNHDELDDAIKQFRQRAIANANGNSG
jgi:enamine deaminase RidA (YjgF/YER057c/UK114 family)